MTFPGARPVRVLYIGGVGRSGTTLVERTLDTEPEFTALGEVMHLWQRSLIDDELCGCGEPFSRCSFWSRVGDIAFGGWHHVDASRVLDLKRKLDRASLAPLLALCLGTSAWRRDIREYATCYAKLYAAAAQVAGTDVVIDSSKQASLPFILLHDPSIDLRVLHCVRDSRAVAYSWTRTVARPEAQTADGESMQRYSPGRMSLTWILHNTVLEGLRLTRVPRMRLRYEDWVAGPSDSVGRILGFCGRSGQPSASVGDTWVELSGSHTCSGNPMRFAQGRIEVSRDNRWRSSFSGSGRRLVTLATSPLLAAYGYLKEEQ